MKGDQVNIRHLQEEREELRSTMKTILDKHGRGERLSFAERSTLDTADQRIAVLNAELRNAEAGRELSNAASAGVPSAPSFGSDDTTAEERAFSTYLRTGNPSHELRTGANEGTNSAGGYLVPPGWWQRLQVALKAYGGTVADFEQFETEDGKPMQWATTNPTAVVGTLLAEATQVSEQDYTFGQGTMSAYMYTGGVQLVSRQLDQDSAFNLDGFVQSRVAESLGRAIAAAGINGTGSSQPLGINTALNSVGSAGTAGQTGTIAPTGGYVTLQAGQVVQMLSSVAATAGNDSTTTELVGNVLAPTTVFSMIEAIDPAYRDLGCKFYMNSNQLSKMRTVVDAYGQPFWKSLYGPNPNILGYDVVVDQNIGNITASTTKGPIFGHVQSAMVKRTVAGASLLRLTERYADFLQIGFIGYMRMDIRSNDLRAAVTVKAAAS